jgi:hypothetical protein
MAILDLRGIICDKTQEAIDEVSLICFIDGVRIQETTWNWGPAKMNDGDARSINHSITFHERVRIELWERDRAGRDDRLGALSLNVSVEEGGEQEYRIAARGADYRLIYALNPQRAERFLLNPVSLHCNDAQERTDEPYIVVNGVTIWGPMSMRTNDTQMIEGEEPVYFTGSGNAIVELWERDAALSERVGEPFRIDHRLATRWAENPREIRTHTFRGDRRFPGDATYTLSFRVSRAELTSCAGGAQ